MLKPYTTEDSYISRLNSYFQYVFSWNYLSIFPQSFTSYRIDYLCYIHTNNILTDITYTDAFADSTRRIYERRIDVVQDNRHYQHLLHFYIQTIKGDNIHPSVFNDTAPPLTAAYIVTYRDSSSTIQMLDRVATTSTIGEGHRSRRSITHDGYTYPYDYTYYYRISFWTQTTAVNNQSHIINGLPYLNCDTVGNGDYGVVDFRTALTYCDIQTQFTHPDVCYCQTRFTVKYVACKGATLYYLAPSPLLRFYLSYQLQIHDKNDTYNYFNVMAPCNLTTLSLQHFISTNLTQQVRLNTLLLADIITTLTKLQKPAITIVTNYEHAVIEPRVSITQTINKPFVTTNINALVSGTSTTPVSYPPQPLSFGFIDGYRVLTKRVATNGICYGPFDYFTSPQALVQPPNTTTFITSKLLPNVVSNITAIALTDLTCDTLCTPIMSIPTCYFRRQSKSCFNPPQLYASIPPSQTTNYFMMINNIMIPVIPSPVDDNTTSMNISSLTPSFFLCDNSITWTRTHPSLGNPSSPLPRPSVLLYNNLLLPGSPITIVLLTHYRGCTFKVLNTSFTITNVDYSPTDTLLSSVLISFTQPFNTTVNITNNCDLDVFVLPKREFYHPTKLFMHGDVNCTYNLTTSSFYNTQSINFIGPTPIPCTPIYYNGSHVMRSITSPVHIIYRHNLVSVYKTEEYNHNVDIVPIDLIIIGDFKACAGPFCTPWYATPSQCTLSSILHCTTITVFYHRHQTIVLGITVPFLLVIIIALSAMFIRLFVKRRVIQTTTISHVDGKTLTTVTTTTSMANKPAKCTCTRTKLCALHKRRAVQSFINPALVIDEPPLGAIYFTQQPTVFRTILFYTILSLFIKSAHSATSTFTLPLTVGATTSFVFNNETVAVTIASRNDVYTFSEITRGIEMMLYTNIKPFCMTAPTYCASIGPSTSIASQCINEAGTNCKLCAQDYFSSGGPCWSVVASNSRDYYIRFTPVNSEPVILNRVQYLSTTTTIRVNGIPYTITPETVIPIHNLGINFRIVAIVTPANILFNRVVTYRGNHYVETQEFDVYDTDSPFFCTCKTTECITFDCDYATSMTQLTTSATVSKPMTYDALFSSTSRFITPITTNLLYGCTASSNGRSLTLSACTGGVLTFEITSTAPPNAHSVQSKISSLNISFTPCLDFYGSVDLIVIVTGTPGFCHVAVVDATCDTTVFYLNTETTTTRRIRCVQEKLSNTYRVTVANKALDVVSVCRTSTAFKPSSTNDANKQAAGGLTLDGIFNFKSTWPTLISSTAIIAAIIILIVIVITIICLCMRRKPKYTRIEHSLHPTK
nr:TPA_asm: hypothetical protein [Polynigra virus 2]